MPTCIVCKHMQKRNALLVCKAPLPVWIAEKEDCIHIKKPNEQHKCPLFEDNGYADNVETLRALVMEAMDCLDVMPSTPTEDDWWLTEALQCAATVCRLIPKEEP